MSAIATPKRHELVAGKTHAHVHGYFPPDTKNVSVTVCGLITDYQAPFDDMPACLICASKLRRARINKKRRTA